MKDEEIVKIKDLVAKPQEELSKRYDPTFTCDDCIFKYDKFASGVEVCFLHKRVLDDIKMCVSGWKNREEGARNDRPNN